MTKKYMRIEYWWKEVVQIEPMIFTLEYCQNRWPIKYMYNTLINLEKIQQYYDVPELKHWPKDSQEFRYECKKCPLRFGSCRGEAF